MLPRIVDGARGARVAAAREAEVLAVHLAENRPAGVEDARDDGGVHVGYVALERRCSVHQGHAGQAHVVLEGDPLALQLARGRARDLALVVPGVVLVVRAHGAVARGARILDERHRVRHGLDRVIGGHAAGHGLEKESDVGVGQGHPELPADCLEFVRSGKFCAGHEHSPFSGRRSTRLDAAPEPLARSGEALCLHVDDVLLVVVGILLEVAHRRRIGRWLLRIAL